MSSSGILTDEEIGQIIDALLEALPSIISDFFGQKVPKVEFTKEEKEKMIPKMYRGNRTKLHARLST